MEGMFMNVQGVMTSSPACCGPRDTARQAAGKMIEHDCGCLPVVDDDSQVTGVVTDRDLATRGLAEGRGPDTPVGELMSRPAVCCGAGADTAEVAKMMAQHQVRRIPVVDDGDHLVGMVAQADLAHNADLDADAVAGTVATVSKPTGGSRSVDSSGSGRIVP
jgi:CBS domain-containing protein